MKTANDPAACEQHSCCRDATVISVASLEVREEVDLPIQLSDFVSITHRTSVLSTSSPGHILLEMDFMRFPSVSIMNGHLAPVTCASWAVFLM